MRWLEPVYPNPFGATAATVAFTLPAAQHVTVRVYDLLGRVVRTLVDEARPAGRHAVRFDPGDLPAGLYVCRLDAGGRQATGRLVLRR